MIKFRILQSPIEGAYKVKLVNNTQGYERFVLTIAGDLLREIYNRSTKSCDDNVKDFVDSLPKELLDRLTNLEYIQLKAQENKVEII